MKTLVAILVVFGFGCSSGQAPAEATRPVAEPPAVEVAPILPRQLESFDYVWKRIKDTHWDVELVGDKWDQAREELRPKVIAATTDDAARALIRDLIGSLGQSHFGLSSRGKPKKKAGGGPADIGVELRILSGEALVVRIGTDSPAAKARLKSGSVIRAVDGVDVGKVLAEHPTPGHGDTGAVATLLFGPSGSTVVLRIEDAKGPRDVSIVREIAKRQMASLGNVEIPVEYESRWLSKKKRVGYVRLSAFADPARISKAFKADLSRFAKAKGVVLDLRGNPGGIGGMAMGMAGMLTDKVGELGTMIQRDSKMKFVVNPQPGAYLGRVAILVDGDCGSTCEILAAGLVDLGRATSFGTNTAGAALPSLFEVLPSGDILQFAVANYVLASGAALEGDGHKPSVVVELDKKSLQAGQDRQLDAALQWIKTGKLR